MLANEVQQQVERSLEYVELELVRPCQGVTGRFLARALVRRLRASPRIVSTSGKVGWAPSPSLSTAG